MKIFDTYSGSAMLNNALLVIENLAELQQVSEITPEIVLNLYDKWQLPKLNQRLKSYTMLFTKNGPLHNDAATGLAIYDRLMKRILSNVELEGPKICEISGLRFQTSFEEIFSVALREAGVPELKIKGKDKTINRCWFPLIGGLGSDAQALPQAKFAVQIHPFCLAIMQFLPLASVIYKGGILLVDSSNFEFAKDMVGLNIGRVRKEIEASKSGTQIENIKDYNKGHYLIKALEFLMAKEYHDEYSDLNLWSFSNSGTGASCEIDRVPNQLIQKLRALKENPAFEKILLDFLVNPKTSGFFLESLADNQEFFGLYPAKNYPGVPPAFLEKYYDLIEHKAETDYAKYIAGLIRQFKSKHFDKYLSKTDAHYQAEYRSDLFAVLVEAAENGMWSLRHHLQILDDKDSVPVKASIYRIYKLVHYYFQNWGKFEQASLPVLKEGQATNVERVAALFFGLVQSYPNREVIVSDLTDSQKYTEVNLLQLFIPQAGDFTLEEIVSLLYVYDEKQGNAFRQDKFGILELLRIYFLQPEKEAFALEKPEVSMSVASGLEKYARFSRDYQDYYFQKYSHPVTKDLPLNKYRDSVLDAFPKFNELFLKWLDEAMEKVNNYKRDQGPSFDGWDEDLLYDLSGERQVAFARFAIQFSLNRTYKETKKTLNFQN